MDDKSFNEMMDAEFGPQTSKRINLENNEASKRDNLGMHTPATMDRFEDADTIGLRGQEFDSRLTGYDAYETYHPGQLEDPVKGPATRKRLDRQKKRYAEEFNVPVGSVQDADIYEQGARVGLTGLTNLTKKPGDSPLDLGPMDYYRTHGLGLDKPGERLGLDVNVQQDGKGKYGRHLTQAFNPESGQNVNEEMTNQYNPAIYSQGKFDKAATKDRKTFLSEGKAYSNMTRDEKNQYNISKYGGGNTGDGRALSNVKGIVAGVAEKIGQGMDFGAEGMADLEEYLGTGTERTRQATRDFWNVSKEDIDKTIGLDKKFQQAAAKELHDNVVKGNYWEAGMSVLKNLDVHLSQSAPEMVLLAGKVPGLFAATAVRVKADSDAYMKKNGKEPDAQRTAQMWLTNAAVLGFEQVIVFKPIKDMIKQMQGVAKTGTGAAKAFKGGAKKAAGSGLFEAGQEIADQAQQTYNVEDRMITGNEAIEAGIAGGVMGTAVRGAPEAIAATANIPKEMERKGQVESGEYVVGDDKELAKEFDSMIHQEVLDEKEIADNVPKDMEKVDSIDKALQSNNSMIRRTAQEFVSEASETEASPENIMKAFNSKLDRNVVLRQMEADVRIKEWDTVGKNVREGYDKGPDTLKEGSIDVKKESKKAERGGLKTFIDVVTFSTGKTARKELNQYTDEALAEAKVSPDASTSLVKYIGQVEEKRKAAKARGLIDTTDGFSPRNSLEPLKEGDRKAYIATIKQGLSVKSYDDTRDVTAMREILNTAVEKGFIKQNQHDIFVKRLDKIKQGAKEPSKETIEAEKEAKEQAKEETGLGSKTISNKEAAEVSRKDYQEEIDEIKASLGLFPESKEGQEFTRILSIEENNRTPEDKKELKIIQDKLESIKGRYQEVQSILGNFTQHEADINEAHSATDEDWFYEGATEYNVEEAFTKEEKDMLGIC